MVRMPADYRQGLGKNTKVLPLYCLTWQCLDNIGENSSYADHPRSEVCRMLAIGNRH